MSRSSTERRRKARIYRRLRTVEGRRQRQTIDHLRAVMTEAYWADHRRAMPGSPGAILRAALCLTED